MVNNAPDLQYSRQNDHGVGDIIIHSSPQAVDAQPVLDGLTAEYGRLYGAYSRPGGARDEIDRYPPQAFSPPLGDFLLLRRGEQTIAGGAFMSHDNETAEIKRVWTHPDFRRQGLARRIVLALEARAAELGYSRSYLSTGFRQPEAVSLYIALGYRPLFDTAADPALYRSLPFEKLIGTRAGSIGNAPVRRPAASFDAATAEVDAIKSAQAEKILARLASHSSGTQPR